MICYNPADHDSESLRANGGTVEKMTGKLWAGRTMMYKCYYSFATVLVYTLRNHCARSSVG